MNNYPLISLIIVTYKKFQYFYETLDSLFCQDYPNIELIISDDASDNFPKKQIENYINKHKKENIRNVIINVNSYNKGTVKNFNIALKMCNGEYFIGVSSDDCLYNNNVISDVVDVFKRTNALIVTTQRLVCKENDLSPIKVLPTIKQQNVIKNNSPEKLFETLCYGNFISGSCTYMSKRCLEQYGYFDEEYQLLEDYPKYLALARQGIHFEMGDFIAIKYRLGGISTDSNINHILMKDNIKLIQKEILPYIDYFNFWVKRYIRYREGRINKKTFIQKFFWRLRYVDIILFYLIKYWK